MSPLGLAVAAPVADHLGIQVWWWIGGISCMLLALMGLFIPAVINIEEDAPDATSNKTETTPVSLSEVLISAFLDRSLILERAGTKASPFRIYQPFNYFLEVTCNLACIPFSSCRMQIYSKSRLFSPAGSWPTFICNLWSWLYPCSDREGLS